MQNMKINAFLEVLSSSEPVPGGGGASGLSAAVGMALGSMVGNLTTGKKKYAAYQEEIEEILEKTKVITEELAEFMNKDAEAFEPLAKAYGLPKDTEEQLAERNRILEDALVTASLAPLSLMEKIVEAMEVMERLSQIGSNLAISDVGVGIQLLKASLKGASLNVYINTKLMKDKEKAEDFNQKADALIARGEQLCGSTYETVLSKIRPAK